MGVQLAVFVARFYLGAALVVAATGSALANEPAEVADPAEALKRAEAGTVRVVALYADEQGELIDVSVGSGFIVAPEHVLTNAHVVSENGLVATAIYVVPDRSAGTTGAEAIVLDGSQELDLAVLKASGLKGAPLHLSTTVPAKSSLVYALGYPGVTDELRQAGPREILRPASPYVTSGTVALASENAPGGANFPTIFHTAAINPGNSGGPLIDQCGRVVGINTWTAGAVVDEVGVHVPVGQHVANQTSNIVALLRRARLEVIDDPAPCEVVTEKEKRIEERLAAAEAAMAAEKLARVELEKEYRSARAGQERMSVYAALAGAAALAGLAVGGFFAFRSKRAGPVTQTQPLNDAGVQSIPSHDSSGEPKGSAASEPE